MTAATQLADVRRRLGLSLDDIATRTKVGVERLAAIEAVDLRGLPPPVYLKGFIRAYAAEVGLDADATADRYITELPDAAAFASSEPASGVYIMPTMEESLEAFESEGPDGDGIAPLHVSHSLVAAPDEAPLRPPRRSRTALPIVVLALVSVVGGIGAFMLSANLGIRGGRRADPDSATAAASRRGSVANATNESSGRAAPTPGSAVPGPPPASTSVWVQSAPTAPHVTRKPAPRDSHAARPSPDTQRKTAPADSPVPTAVILVPGFPTQPRATTTAGTHAADDISGVWTVTSQVEAASVDAYKNLLLGFRVELEQRGNRVVGTGHKITENGAPLPARRRTPINLEGTLDGNRLALAFTEHGTRRASAGRFELYLSGDGSFRGRFTSDAAQSSGETIAVREAAARD